MLEIIYAIQVVLAIMFALWTYDRYAKRWPATLGDDVVTGSVVDVGYLVVSEGGGYVCFVRLFRFWYALLWLF